MLKRYAILAEGRTFEEGITIAASDAAFLLLPPAGKIDDGAGNHGVGLQIIHFAQVAAVSPIFYWQWGSVLARAGQIRANWDTPDQFYDGASDVIDCVWEMDILSYEVFAWKDAVLGDPEPPSKRLGTYMGRQCV